MRRSRQSCTATSLQLDLGHTMKATLTYAMYRCTHELAAGNAAEMHHQPRHSAGKHSWDVREPRNEEIMVCVIGFDHLSLCD